MLAVVEADADDLLRVGHGRQQLDGGEREAVIAVRRRLEVTERARLEQVPHRAGLAGAERIAGVHNPVPVEHPGPDATIGAVADQPHPAKPNLPAMP